jgi:hypothetical protein
MLIHYHPRMRKKSKHHRFAAGFQTNPLEFSYNLPMTKMDAIEGPYRHYGQFRPKII